MENYDDVRQFINKVGDQNLNYRSFQTNTPSSGQSKWRLINQVANYTQTLSNTQPQSVQPLRYFEPQYAGSQAALHSEPPIALHLAQQQVGASNPFRRQKADSDVAHLHRKPQQQLTAEDQSTKTDSLAALFYRIAL